MWAQDWIEHAVLKCLLPELINCKWNENVYTLVEENKTRGVTQQHSSPYECAAVSLFFYKNSVEGTLEPIVHQLCVRQTINQSDSVSRLFHNLVNSALNQVAWCTVITFPVASFKPVVLQLHVVVVPRTWYDFIFATRSCLANYHLIVEIQKKKP